MARAERRAPVRHTPPPGAAVRPISSARRWALRAAGAAGALAAAAGVLLVVRPGAEAPLDAAPSRGLEVRLTHPGARAHKPYDVPRAGGPQAGERVPLDVLAKLEKRGDARGVATAWLLRGEKEQAALALARAPEGSDTSSDRAALALVRGKVDEALDLLDAALDAAPGHPQALWNRGLALRELGMPLAAAEAFETVEKLAEPGWAAEAGQRAAALRRDAAEPQRTWREAWTAGVQLVSGGAVPGADELRRHPGLSRLFFYDALRTAPGPERVRALLPMAAALDAIAGGSVLQELARAAEGRDFAARATLAAEYARIVRGELPEAAGEALGARAAAAGLPDLAVGGWVRARVARAHLGELEKLAVQTKDPWFAALAAQERAKERRARGDLLGAERLLVPALRDCAAARVDYRCAGLELALADLYFDLNRPLEAWGQAQSAFRRSRAGGEVTQQADELAMLAKVAQLRFSFALSRAALREVLLRRPDDCATQAYVHEVMATLSLMQLRVDDARRELQAAPLCNGASPDLYRAALQSELARIGGQPAEAAAAAAGLRRLREAGTLSRSEAAVALAMEGRALVVADRAAGRSTLRGALEEAARLPASDDSGRKTRGYASAGLAFAAGAAGEWEAALAALAEEQGAQSPRRCALGGAVEEDRALWVARGAGGELLGRHGALAPGQAWRAPPVPAELVKALEPCASVAVLARPPLHGKSGLLPAHVAWSYRVARAVPRPAAPVAPRELVVADVEAPAALGLPRLESWSTSAQPEARRVELRGPLATRSRLLQELGDATGVEIHAHGLVDLAGADASLIVLSPDVDGNGALTAADLHSVRLRGAPVVLLAACHAAWSAASLHTPWSLPVAFVESGARAVLASPGVIPDGQAAAFFDGVRARMRTGQDPARALRDERMTFRSRPGGGWVDEVLLFEPEEER